MTHIHKQTPPPPHHHSYSFIHSFIVIHLNVILPEKVSGHLGELLDGAAAGGEVHVEVVVADGVVMDEDIFTLGAGDNVALQSCHRLPAPGHMPGRA